MWCFRAAACARVVRAGVPDGAGESPSGATQPSAAPPPDPPGPAPAITLSCSSVQYSPYRIPDSGEPGLLANQAARGSRLIQSSARSTTAKQGWAVHGDWQRLCPSQRPSQRLHRPQRRLDYPKAQQSIVQEIGREHSSTASITPQFSIACAAITFSGVKPCRFTTPSPPLNRPCRLCINRRRQPPRRSSSYPVVGSDRTQWRDRL